MSFEWVGSAATATVGLAGIVATYLTQARQRDHQHKVAIEQDLRQSKSEFQQNKRVAYAKLTGVLFTTINYAFINKQVAPQLREQIRRNVDDEVRQRLRNEVLGDLNNMLPPEQLEKVRDTIDESIEQRLVNHILETVRDETLEQVRAIFGYSSTATAMMATEQWEAASAEVIFLSEDRLRMPVLDATRAVRRYMTATEEDEEQRYTDANNAIRRMQEAMLDDLQRTVE